MEIDLDEVLDIEDDLERRGFVKVILTAASAQSIIRSLLYYFQKILTDSNSSQEIINVRFKWKIFLSIFIYFSTIPAICGWLARKGKEFVNFRTTLRWIRNMFSFKYEIYISIQRLWEKVTQRELWNSDLYKLTKGILTPKMILQFSVKMVIHDNCGFEREVFPSFAHILQFKMMTAEETYTTATNDSSVSMSSACG